MTSRFLSLLNLFLALLVLSSSVTLAQNPVETRPCPPSFAPHARTQVLSKFEKDSSLTALRELYGQALEIENRAQGPWLYLRAQDRTRKLEEIDDLKIASYNMYNILETRGKHELDPKTGKRVKIREGISKPEAKLIEQGKLILREDPDIFFAQEVESLEAALILNEKHLQGRYRPVVIDGNDSRGINIVAFFKKDLPFDLEVQSHRELRAEYNGEMEELFSRDLPIIQVRPKGADRSEKPLMVLMGQHLKSKRDGLNDPESTRKRILQVKKSAELLTELEARHPGVPILQIGDFNGYLRTGPEFEAFWSEAGLKDSFELALQSQPRGKVITHTYHPFQGKTRYGQLDGVLVSRAGQKKGWLRESKVVPYRDSAGKPKPVPRDRKKRDENPSDHFMIVTRWAFQKILSAY